MDKLHYSTIKHTSAIVPMGFFYDDDEEKWFGSPQQTECAFYGFFGPDISNDYVSKLEEFLKCIHDTIVKGKESNLHLVNNGNIPRMNSELVFLNLSFPQEGWVSMDSILVRPCGRRLGISKLVFWQIIKTCLFLGLVLRFDNPLTKTREALKRLEPMVLVDEENKSAFCGQLGLSLLKLSLFQIENLLVLDPSMPPFHLKLNSASFPPAAVFNDGIDPAKFDIWKQDLFTGPKRQAQNEKVDDERHVRSKR